MSPFKRSKILIVAPYFFPQCHGGAPHVYREVQRLSRHEICIYTSYEDGSLAACRQYDASTPGTILRAKDLVFHVGNRGRLGAMIAAVSHIVAQTQRLVAAVKEFRPDVICCGAIRCTGWLVYLVGMITGKRVASYVHGEELTIARDRGPWAQFMRWGERKVLLSSETIVAVSTFTRDKIVESYGVDRDRIKIINNGVALDNFFPVPRSSRMVERYKLAGKKVLLTLTRLEKKKGVDKVIAALPQVLERIPDVVYLIGGRGSERPYLDALIKRLGVEDRVIFADFVPDEELNDFMNLADVFVLANHAVDGDTEGFGLVFLQANACRVPVIGGRDGGTADAVEDGVSGLLVDGNDVMQIAGAVTRLMSDESLRKKFGAAGYSRVTGAFSWQRKVDEFDSAIYSVSEVGCGIETGVPA